MKYPIKLILSILAICIFVCAAIISAQEHIVIAILCGAAAFVDSFVFMMPTIFSTVSIRSSKIDPNMYSYKRRHFVDRKEIYKDIKNQIKTLDKSLEKMIWIRLHGNSGIGKKTLISKLFDTYSYPWNKFYFLRYEYSDDLVSLMTAQFPLRNENFSREIYFNQLSRCNRTFIVINADFQTINEKIAKFMSEWAIYAKKHHKLIFITYDNDITQAKLKNQTYIFEYELNPLACDDAIKYINILLRNNCQDPNKIVQFSKGVPATIKFICENTNKKNVAQRDLIDFIINMRNDLKTKYIQLCTLTLVKGNISENQIIQILTLEERKELLNEKKLVFQDNTFIVPSWLLDYIRFSNHYYSYFIDSIDILHNKQLLSAHETTKAHALVVKEWTNILSFLKYLESKKDFVGIKEFYDKSSLDFSLIDNDIKIEILLIFMNALLKVGAYNSFEYLVEKSKKKFVISSTMTFNDYKYNCFLADFYHLTSQYEISNTLFEALLICPFGKTYSNELNFHIAHNFRHQGKLDDAKQKFKTLVKTCDKDSVVYKRTVTALISIDYYRGAYCKEKHIRELSELLSNDHTDFNIIRHIANVYRREYSDYNKAIEVLEKKLAVLEQKSLRIVQDFYFELAECYRFLCNDNLAYYNESITYYNKAILFSELNHDINLQLCSCVGKALLIYKKMNDKKLLDRQLLNILPLAQKTSKIIVESIITILSSVGNSNIANGLLDSELKHHLLIAHSKQITLLHVTVM